MQSKWLSRKLFVAIGAGLVLVFGAHSGFLDQDMQEKLLQLTLVYLPSQGVADLLSKRG